MKDSLIEYSLVVRGSIIGTKTFATLYVSVTMADKIGVKDGKPSVTIFWNLAEPYVGMGRKPGYETRVKSF